MPNEINHTFVIIAYLDSLFLEDCVISLQNQTVKSNIIISTSTPSAFLDKVSKKYQLPLIINEDSQGVASDWSFAYSLCTTKYLTLAHQDDIYLSKYTEFCLTAAGKSSEGLLAFTDYSEFLSDKLIRNQSVNLFIKKFLLLPFLIKSEISFNFLKRLILSFGDPIPCPTVMYNKENIGYFEFSRDFVCNMDWDAWLRLARKRGSFIYINKKLMLHRIHQDSQTSLQIKNKVRQEEERRIFGRLWPRPLARILANIYSLSLSSNKV